jgi:DNA-binding response OmpR family regulator
LILSDKDQDENIAAGLSAGADDYMSKPFSPQVLQERVRVNLIKAEQLAPVSGERA